MLDPTDLLDDENWHGGYYELAIDLGERSDAESDLRLAAALDALWTGENLDGCYLDRRSRRSDQGRVRPASIDFSEPPSLNGVAQLADGRRLVCASHVIREVEVAGQISHDWLDFCLPLGALARIDDRVGAYPFDEQGSSLAWRSCVDDFLIDAARRVSGAVSFRLALVGFEVSGAPAAELFTGQPPDERWATYVVPRPGGVDVFPANR